MRAQKKNTVGKKNQPLLIAIEFKTESIAGRKPKYRFSSWLNPYWSEFCKCNANIFFSHSPFIHA